MLTSGEILRFSALVLWENFGGNRIFGQRKTRKKTKETKNFDEKIPKSGMQIVVGAGSHARPIRRSQKTERNGIKFLRGNILEDNSGQRRTTKDNIFIKNEMIKLSQVVLCCPMLSSKKIPKV